MSGAVCRIQGREDQEYKLQSLLFRAVARNRSFRSGNFFILSTTSSFVRIARGGRFFVSVVVLSFFMVALSTGIAFVNGY